MKTAESQLIQSLKEVINTEIDPSDAMQAIGHMKHLKMYARRAMYWAKEINKETEKRFDIIYECGVYFGYPKCCVMEFISDTKECNEHRIKKRDLNNGKGFIPCTEHYSLIRMNVATADEVIKNRVCKVPY